jgi:protein-disulfide isomerase
VRGLTRRAAIATAAAAGGLLAAPAWAAVKAAPGDMSLGDPRAPVHVVEYLSLTCPHCADFHETVFPAFKAKYIDTGRVYFTVRELLTAPANVAAAGFLMARCNGGARYFQIVDQVFRSQPRWQSGNIKPLFVEIAKQNGLTEAQFEACLVDEKASAALQARLEYATDVDKVTGTPTFFVNGVMLPNQEVPTLAVLDAAIAKALRAVPPAAKAPPPKKGSR